MLHKPAKSSKASPSPHSSHPSQVDPHRTIFPSRSTVPSHRMLNLQQTIGNMALQRAIFQQIGLNEEALTSRKSDAWTNSVSNYGYIKYTKADGQQGKKEAYSSRNDRHSEEKLIGKLKSEEQFTDREIKDHAPYANLVNRVDEVYSEREPCHVSYTDSERKKRQETDRECHDYLERILHRETPVYFSAQFNESHDEFNNYHNRVKAVVYYEKQLEPYYEGKIQQVEHEFGVDLAGLRGQVDGGMKELKRLFSEPVGTVNVSNEERERRLKYMQTQACSQMKAAIMEHFREKLKEYRYSYNRIYDQRKSYEEKLFKYYQHMVKPAQKAIDWEFVVGLSKGYRIVQTEIEQEIGKEDQSFLDFALLAEQNQNTTANL